MRLRYRFPLVRDPEEYQRLLADMRRRCPTIAEAADHPLTEWEILHANALWDWLAGAVGVGICVGICIAFWLGAGTPSFFLCYLIFLLLPLQRHRCGPFVRSMLQWKTERMESLWLTPLTVRQLLATEAARARARTGGTGRWGALFVLAVIGACGAWLIERRLGGRPFWPERASLHAGVWAVLASWLIENRDSMTRSGWRRAYRILYNLHEQRQGRLPARRIARIALILVISYSFAGGVFWALTRYGAWCRATWAALAGMPLWIWGAALGALAVAGAAILGPARLRSADQAFQRAAKKGQKMYEELVHALAETT